MQNPALARHRWLVPNIIAQLGLGLLAMTICLPSMQEWPAIFGASQAAVQLTFSAYVATYGGLQLVYGPWSDRVGRRRVLMFGIALGSLGSLLAALAPNLTVLIAARALQGAGTAAGMVVGRALVQDFFSGSERTRVMAMLGATMGLVPPAATLLGGQLHVHVGWQANFVVLIVLAAVLFVAAWRGLPDRDAAAPARGSGLRQLASDYRQLARTPGFGWFVMLLACTTATFYTFLGGAPIVLANYGVGPERLGWYVMAPPIAYIFGNMLTSRLLRTHDEAWILTLGQVVTIASLLLVLLLGWTGPKSPWSFSLPLLLLGIGHGLLVPPTLTGTVGLVPALAGSAAAVAGLMQQVGGAVASFLVGVVPHEGQVNLALLMLAWSGLASLAVLPVRASIRTPPAGR